RASAVGDAREHRQHRDAEVARDLDLLARVHRERDEAVDVARVQASVVERRLGRFAGEPEFAPPRRLGELGLSDAGDGGAVAQRAAHDPARGRGRPITAVPDRCSPLSLVARNSTSTRPSPSSCDVPVTVPAYSSTEPAYAGRPSRIAIIPAIAFGPAQLVRQA